MLDFHMNVSMRLPVEVWTSSFIPFCVWSPWFSHTPTSLSDAIVGFPSEFLCFSVQFQVSVCPSCHYCCTCTSSLRLQILHCACQPILELGTKKKKTTWTKVACPIRVLFLCNLRGIINIHNSCNMSKNITCLNRSCPAMKFRPR